MNRADRERHGGLLHRARMRALGLRWVDVLVIDEVAPAPGGGFLVLRSHTQPQWVGRPQRPLARLAAWVGLEPG